jgi:hypothetical protein
MVRSVQNAADMPTAESVVRSFHYAPSKTDRRVHHRAPLDAPVLLDNLRAWVSARCRDVSLSGVCLECPGADMLIGERVDVYFELPNGFAVEAAARVVRTDGHQVGLEFVALDRTCLLALRAHCRPFGG